MLPEKEACLRKVGSGTLTRTGAGITVRPPCSDTNGACGILLLPLSLVSVNIRGLLVGIMATLVGRMFWTDKGPKYLVMLIILSLVIYMFATLLGSTNITEDIGISSKV